RTTRVGDQDAGRARPVGLVLRLGELRAAPEPDRPARRVGVGQRVAAPEPPRDLVAFLVLDGVVGSRPGGRRHRRRDAGGQAEPGAAQVLRRRYERDRDGNGVGARRAARRVVADPLRHRHLRPRQRVGRGLVVVPSVRRDANGVQQPRVPGELRSTTMHYTTSRRRFLMQLGGAAAAGASTPLWLELLQQGGLPFAWGAGESDVLPTGTPICVHIALDGGNDYLNTLVPINDGWYLGTAAGHGAIALSPSETLALNGNSTYRLHGSLPWLANRWNTVGDVGFALGVGNMEANFSHFDSMKYWQTARLDVLGKTGWLGRYADSVRPQNPLASVSISDLRADAVGATAPS